MQGCDSRKHIQHCLHDRQSWEDGYYVNAPMGKCKRDTSGMRADML